MLLEFYAAMFVFLKGRLGNFDFIKSCEEHFVVTAKSDGFVFI